MTYFPAEVLERIFALLTSQRDRNSVCLVCKYWWKVEAGCRLRVSVKNCYALGPNRVLARFPRMRALSLKGKPHFAGLNIVNWGGFALPWIEFFAKNCPWLQELRLKRMVVSDQSLQLISLSFSEFESLSLIRCGGFSPVGLVAIASNCRFLKELVLLENEVEEDIGHILGVGVGDGIGQWLSCFPESCSSLVSLNFACTKGVVNLEALEKLVARCPNLRSLRLNRRVPPNVLQRLLQQAPQLEDLGIGSFSNYTDRRTYLRLQNAVLKCRSIRSLSGFSSFTPLYQAAIYPMCSNLISLNLSKAVLDNIGDKGLGLVADTCKNLQELRVFRLGPHNEGNPALTEEGLIAISMGCPQLHSLVYCCDQMTNASLITVARNCPNLTNFKLCINDPKTPDHTTSQPFDEGFGAIVQSCKRLRRLSLSGLLSDQVFLYIGMYAEQLEMLSIGSSGGGDKELSYVLNGCRNLMKLEIKGSPFVDAGLLEEIVKHEKIRCLWISSSKVTLGGCRALSMQGSESIGSITNAVEDGDSLQPPWPSGATPRSQYAPATRSSRRTGDAFMDLMVANFNSARVLPKPPMGYTENASATFLSSGNPALTSSSTSSPTLRRRGVRGTGKSDKEGYYTAALWLHGLHPKTFACNAAGRARRPANCEESAEDEEQEEGQLFCTKIQFGHGKLGKNKKTKKGKHVLPREVRVKAEMERAKAEKETARVCRKERRLAMAKKAVERYGRDPDYRFLHDRISDLFAEHLKSDLQLLNSGNVNKVSLAAKCAPPLTLRLIGRLFSARASLGKFPKSDPEYEGVEDAHYAYRVRDRLRKQVLVPLRRALELPEVYMGANRWSELPYNRVASVAMKTYKERFIKHDEARFFEYLSSVRAGKAKIAAGALLPHEIISSLEDEDGGQVAELQWQRMVEDVSKKGKLKNCIAVCDVSGSMFGIPMEVSVALGILVSELSEDPWKGKVITFSKTPELHMITGEDLRSKANFVREMNWGMNTDFQKVFDLILQVAVNGKLSQDAMIKRIIVFSDMEFDQASANSWETDYEAIKRKFRESGYEAAVPEIVFWNLRTLGNAGAGNRERGGAGEWVFKESSDVVLGEWWGYESGGRHGSRHLREEYDKLIVMD
ncbi:Protein auxin signaling F-BOX 3 [Vitis vinifera]|uniref:Protein auxin signaling F-BOX 3 n=1 Tax=Vitis vinifera TaxID=29760 RepID=A0A438HIA8_VITVI|nr:Protein auxin signaling F-BOX 3 [Vitis vinifera]